MKTLCKLQYSVLMSVYFKENADVLRESMNSIWQQTIQTDDFVLVCDGPLNELLDKVVAEMQNRYPHKLHVKRLSKNSGLGNALNYGLKYCKHELVARMDSDDISIPERCEKQLRVFCNNPKISICSGTVVDFVDTIDNVIGKRVLPEFDTRIKEYSKKRNPFNHPAVMFRKSFVEQSGGYMETFPLFEDYYLWIRMLKKGAIGYNIRETILFMRTPQALYRRRGGYLYTINMLKFHKWILSIQWSTWWDFMTGALPHALICMLPSNVRALVYKYIHR